MIVIQNLNFGYRNKTVFDNLSLSFDEGKIYGLLGLNGSGKSTLLYLISGLLFPKSGKVLLDGEDVSLRKPLTLSSFYIVPEEFDFPNVTFDRYMKMYAPFYPNFSSETFNRCLDGFEVDTSQKLSKLSMGQKKKALMSFALATNTKYLLMDEPTNGLDIPSKSQFRKVVSSCMTDERTIIVSTHQVKDVENLIDQIAIIGDKKLVFNHSVGEITEKLIFEHSKSGETPQGVIYSQSVLGGSSIVRSKTAVDQETPLDIEFLFNAVLSEPQKINEIF